jgi:hypothetical protein
VRRRRVDAAVEVHVGVSIHAAFHGSKHLVFSPKIL